MIHMSNFRPYIPEEKVTVEITRREAILLEKLRKCAFGEIVIFKAEGLVIRVEIKNSELIDPRTEINLA